MQSLSDIALGWQFSYQALLQLGHYCTYLAHAELPPTHLSTLLSSPSLQRGWSWEEEGDRLCSSEAR